MSCVRTSQTLFTSCIAFFMLALPLASQATFIRVNALADAAFGGLPERETVESSVESDLAASATDAAQIQRSQGTFTNTAQSNASGNLRTATVSASANAVSRAPFASTSARSAATADSRFLERLSFTGAPANSRIKGGLDLTGFFNIPDPIVTESGITLSRSADLVARLRIIERNPTGGADRVEALNFEASSRNDIESFRLNETLVFDVLLINPDPIVDILLLVGAGAFYLNDGAAEASLSASLFLESTPGGVPFRSDSGVFLTPPPEPTPPSEVPIPGTLSLVLAPLGLFAIRKKLRLINTSLA